MNIKFFLLNPNNGFLFCALQKGVSFLWFFVFCLSVTVISFSLAIILITGCHFRVKGISGLRVVTSHQLLMLITSYCFRMKGIPGLSSGHTHHAIHHLKKYLLAS